MASMAAALGWSPEVTMWRCWTWCVVWPPMPSQRSSWVARTGISTSREIHSEAMVKQWSSNGRAPQKYHKKQSQSIPRPWEWPEILPFMMLALPRRDLLLTSRQDVVFRFAMEATASYLPVEGLQAQDRTYIYMIYTHVWVTWRRSSRIWFGKNHQFGVVLGSPCWHLLTSADIWRLTSADSFRFFQLLARE